MGILAGIALALVLALPLVAAQEPIRPESVSSQWGAAEVSVTILPEGIQEGIIILEHMPAGLELYNAAPRPDRVEGRVLKWMFINKTGVREAVVKYSLRPLTGIGGAASGEWLSIDSSGTIRSRATGATKVSLGRWDVTGVVSYAGGMASANMHMVAIAMAFIAALYAGKRYIKVGRNK